MPMQILANMRRRFPGGSSRRGMPAAWLSLVAWLALTVGPMFDGPATTCWAQGRASESASQPVTPSDKPLSPEAARSLSWAFTAILGIVLAFVVLITGLLVLRSLRRARQRLLRPPNQPTEYVDVWRMHKLPDEAAGEDRRNEDA